MTRENVTARVLLASMAAVSLVLLSGYALGQESEPGDAPAATPVPAPEPSSPPPDSEPVANTDNANGPPEEALPPPPPAADGEAEAPDAEGESGWYRDKSNEPYFDLFAAWGWKHHSYLLTVSPFNFYLVEPDDWPGFHARILALGVLSFERQIIEAGVRTSTDRETTPFIEVLDPTLLIHAGPAFLALGFDFGLEFYDGLVPTLDVQAGLGFTYAGWGIETGLRSSRLPRAVSVINGDEFVHVAYDAQLYVNIETNIGW